MNIYSTYYKFDFYNMNIEKYVSLSSKNYYYATNYGEKTVIV